jgi:hypothetical protein
MANYHKQVGALVVVRITDIISHRVSIVIR